MVHSPTKSQNLSSLLPIFEKQFAQSLVPISLATVTSQQPHAESARPSHFHPEGLHVALCGWEPHRAESTDFPTRWSELFSLGWTPQHDDEHTLVQEVSYQELSSTRLPTTQKHRCVCTQRKRLYFFTAPEKTTDNNRPNNMKVNILVDD